VLGPPGRLRCIQCVEVDKVHTGVVSAAGWKLAALLPATVIDGALVVVRKFRDLHQPQCCDPRYAEHTHPSSAVITIQRESPWHVGRRFSAHLDCRSHYHLVLGARHHCRPRLLQLRRYTAQLAGRGCRRRPGHPQWTRSALRPEHRASGALRAAGFLHLRRVRWQRSPPETRESSSPSAGTSRKAATAPD
jgi:hypothetical protein